MKTLAIGLVLVAVGAPGCVERNMRISSDPGGARVFVNDEEVGVTPTKVSFLWYGDYDIVLRKEGYETLKTRHRVVAPWYQWPVIDLVAECLVPVTIRDEHVLPEYKLAKTEAPAAGEIIERAEQLRDRALYERP